MTDPWRLRCPKGHSTVRVYDGTYRCNACEQTYAGEPYDAKHTDFPVDEEPLPKNIHDEILEEIVRRCEGPMCTRLRSRDITIHRPKTVGRLFAELEREGFVERLGSGANKGYHWRPTEKGRRRVIECERKLALEAGPANRERAEVDPVATGLLSLFVALVLLSGYALAMGAVL